jgi:hypothetical protein
MTNYEREIFSKLLDVSWEMDKKEHSKLIKEALNSYYFKLRDELKDSMGEKEYNNFIKEGKQMFA